MRSLTAFIARVGERRIVLSIAVAALGLQLIGLPEPNVYGEPYLVAKNIVAGKGFVFTYPLTTQEGPTAYITPLYVLIAVPALLSGLGERGLQVLNILLL